MKDALSSLRTESALIHALERAVTKTLSAEELLEQRVSFIDGTLDVDNDLTRAAIQRILVQQTGGAGWAP